MLHTTGTIRGAVLTFAVIVGAMSCMPESGTTPLYQPSAEPPPPPPPPPGGAATLVGAGDIGRCGTPDPENTARLLDGIEGTVFTLGDNAYNSGTITEFDACYHPNWGRHKARTYPVPGNHDYETPGAAGYFGYYGVMAGPAGRGYYGFKLGDWYVLSLNSNVASDAASPQMAWVRTQLAANETKCAIAMWHHPVFSSGAHGNNTKMREIWRVLDSAGVDLVLVGHDHNYERFAPQDYLANPDPNGIRSFVVGTGGTGLRSVSTVRANSEVRDADTHGVLKLTLRADSYDWEFVPAAGKTFTDQGTAQCVE